MCNVETRQYFDVNCNVANGSINNCKVTNCIITRFKITIVFLPFATKLIIRLPIVI